VENEEDGLSTSLSRWIPMIDRPDPEPIDLEGWSRREAFELFRSFGFPYLSLTAEVDVTLLRQATRGGRVSFTIGLVHAVARAANAVAPLRQRLRGDAVVEHRVVHPSVTILVEDDCFRFCTLPFDEDLTVFAASAAERIETALIHYDRPDESGPKPARVTLLKPADPEAMGRVLAAALGGRRMLLVDLAGTEKSWLAGVWPIGVVAGLMPAAMFAVSLLMVSRVPYPHLVNQYVRAKKPFKTLVTVVIVTVAAFVEVFVTGALIALVYVAAGPVRVAWAHMRPRGSPAWRPTPRPRA